MEQVLPGKGDCLVTVLLVHSNKVVDRGQVSIRLRDRDLYSKAVLSSISDRLFGQACYNYYILFATLMHH